MENPFENIITKLDNIEKLLLQIRSDQEMSNKNSNPENELMDIKQLSEYLQVSVATIYTYTHSRIIPFIKRSKRLYFMKNDIEELLSKGRRKTIDEIESEANTYMVKRRMQY